jgi:hypothetical protein
MTTFTTMTVGVERVRLLEGTHLLGFLRQPNSRVTGHPQRVHDGGNLLVREPREPARHSETVDQMIQLAGQEFQALVGPVGGTGQGDEAIDGLGGYPVTLGRWKRG